MSNVAAQQRVIEDVESVKYITAALRDISAVEMRHLRKRFLRNRMFYEELHGLYQLVWRIAESARKTTLLSLEKKSTLNVAYTTNRHFYGSLNSDVVQAFVKGTDSSDSCLIIGSTGKELWRTAGKKRKEVRFLSFKDDEPNSEEVKTFLEQIAAYSSIIVFYPSFISVYEQRANAIDITFRPSTTDTTHSVAQPLPQYFLEPDLEQMSLFFNTQVRYMLFERMLLETELSRVAARLVRMDIADHNAHDMLKHEYRELRRAYSTFSSSRMLETLVGYIQWHNTKI